MTRCLRGKCLWILAFSLLAAFLLFRAFTLSFTHDESLSYTIVEYRSVWRKTANHHPMNTWLMTVANRLLGHSEISLRLPSLGMFVVAAFFASRLFARARYVAPSILCFAVLFLNPFAIEFFALARGYGPSMACVVASLYFLVSSGYSWPMRFLLSVSMAVLAASANLSAINFLFAVTVVTFVLTLKRVRGCGDWRARLVAGAALLLGAASIVTIVKRLLLLRQLDQLYSGSDTLKGAATEFLIATAGQDSPWTESLAVFFVTAVVGTTLGLGVLRRASHATKTTTVLLVIILVAIVLQRELTGAHFPPPRAATYILPLFATFCFFVVQDILVAAAGAKWRSSIGALVLVVATILAGNFAKNANVRFSTLWKYDAETKKVARVLEAIATQFADERQLTVANHWLFEPTLNYYIQTRGIPMQPADRDGVRAEVDLIYTFEGEQVPPSYLPLMKLDTAGTILYVADEDPVRSVATTVVTRF